MATNNTNDIVIKARADVAQAVANLRRLQRNINTTGKKAYTQLARQQEVVYQSQQRLNKSLGKVPFAGYALSIMFFGAALVNTFKQIATFGVRSFQDVMHSVDGTVTQFDLLGASMLYLGFTIGQALEPVIAWLIPIIDSIAEWVSENQKLTAGLLVAVGVLGVILTLGGSLKLAFDGFVGAFALLGPAISAAGSAFATFFAAIGVAGFGLLLVALLAFIAAWQTNFAGIRDFVKNTFDVIWGIMKGVFGGIIDIVKGVIKILKGIFEGDFTMLWEGLVQVVEGFKDIMFNIFVGLGAAIYNIFALSMNLVSGIILGTIRLLLDGIRLAVQAAERMTGFDLGSGAVVGAISKLDSLRNATKVDYISGEQVQQAISYVTDNRIININVDSSASSDVGSTLLREIEARRT